MTNKFRIYNFLPAQTGKSRLNELIFKNLKLKITYLQNTKY